MHCSFPGSGALSSLRSLALQNNKNGGVAAAVALRPQFSVNSGVQHFYPIKEPAVRVYGQLLFQLAVLLKL